MGRCLIHADDDMPISKYNDWDYIMTNYYTPRARSREQAGQRWRHVTAALLCLGLAANESKTTNGIWNGLRLFCIYFIRNGIRLLCIFVLKERKKTRLHFILQGTE